MTFAQEAELDLLTERCFGPAFGYVLTTAVDLLLEEGYPPEAVLEARLAMSIQQIQDDLCRLYRAAREETQGLQVIVPATLANQCGCGKMRWQGSRANPDKTGEPL